MDCFIIEGPNKIVGEVNISGAKNASLPIIFATVLTDERCIIKNVPNLLDIKTTYELLSWCGKECFFGFNRFEVYERSKITTLAPYDLVRKMRASVLIAGPMLGRFGSVRFSLPGGCAIGVRPIDIHLEGFKKLGAEINLDGGYVIMKTKKLRGAHIKLRFPSVGATENLMMAASLIDDVTIIENAAKEPEVLDLVDVLNKMGARIEVKDGGVIRIKGAKRLKGFEHTVIPDRIEAGTFAILACASKGEILIKNASSNHLRYVLKKLRESGAYIEEDDEKIFIKAPKKIKPVNIETKPYPGFPTDLQAQWMAYMLVASGRSVITENIFENRFMHVPEFMRMGANIRLDKNKAYIDGVKVLNGATVMVSDLRAGAGLVIAACVARGISKIRRVYHIDRGYERIDEKLKILGVKIKREEE